MAVNLPNNPANGDSVLLNGTTYVYNSTNNSWDIPLVTEATLPLTTLSVGPEATPSGDGAISYDNTTGIFTYTPPVVSSGGSGTIAYANTTDLPTSGVTTGAMAYVSGNNKLYMWNGTAWFNIAIVNQAPTAITGNQATYELSQDGTPTVVTLVSTDPEGLPLTFSSSTSGDTQVGTLSQTNNVFTITPSTNEADIGTLSVTFSVTDGNNTETSVSSFILEFLSPYWNETVLSIGTSSTNGLNNSTFIDRSTNTHTVTPIGAPVQTAFHPYLDNWSVEFDGSGDYLTPSEVLLPATGDFTLECWYYLKDKSSRTDLYSQYLISSGGRFVIYIESNQLNIFLASLLISTLAIENNQWQHFALTRSGSTFTLYLDGELIGTGISSASIYQANPYIGFQDYNGGSWNGYISDFRVSGSVVYESAFTPPTTPLTAVAGTSILTCQSNRFIDNSSNAYAITVNGNPKISAFNPFGQESEYAVGENKGATYFDETSALTVPNDTAFNLTSGDWTIEGWFYATGTSTVIIQKDNRAFTSYPQWTITGEANLIIGSGTGTSYIQYFTQSSTQPENQWTHFAWVREGTAIRGYINGSLAVSGTQTGTMTDGGTDVGIGRRIVGNDGYFDGYISDLSITKGTAKYTDDFAIPTAPINNGNSLYLPFDNAGIFDKTGLNTLTPVGNASTSTTQTKYADTAMYFDGSGDYFVFNPGDVTAFGTGDFTVESWVYMNNLHVFSVIDTRTSISTNNWGLFRDVSNGGRVQWNYSTGNYYSTGTDKWSSVGVYQHIVYCRSNGTGYFFIDGELLGTVTDTNNYVGSSAAYIGSRYEGTSTIFLNGYLENFQILKGVAKYTANFTPPNRTQGLTYQEQS